MKTVILIALLAIPTISLAQSISGKWVTVDDVTGKQRSVVEIYENQGKYFGKIVELFRGPGEEEDPVCEECEDHRKGQKIIGMEIISNMKKVGEELDGGEIMDPESGSIYKCKIWREGDELKVRGYLYFLYRTQTWRPLD